MCSIFGAYGTPDPALIEKLRRAAGDRGRDGGRVETYNVGDGLVAVLGNWRATPTPEHQQGRLQPYDQLVHNGTIANDKELGGREDEIDSEVLARVLDRTSLESFVASLAKVRGSYAIACLGGPERDMVYLAANYKPVHYLQIGETTYFSSMERHFDAIAPWGCRPARLAPYSAINLLSTQRLPLPRQSGKRAIVIASAGLDSTVVAASLVAEGYEVRLVHFLYGCHAQGPESACIPKIAEALGCSYDFVPLPFDQMKGSSPLLNAGAEISGGVAGAEYAHEWVPARNLVMLSIATAYAEANGFHVIALGNNLEESGAYPDNEEQFTLQFDSLLPMAVHDGYEVRVVAPVGNLMKHEIVKLGLRLGAPFKHTWSCYRGGARHCGQCGPCFMRRTAFERNGASDPVFE